ncbi:MAG: LD-carboxypeptidase [Alphaproteobacteria bacterium]|nr:LD-carboxypeptidase [Alphaproteobacteria bacterium]
MRIGIVAPASRIDESTAERVRAIAQQLYAEQVELYFHPQCFLSSGHFAGEDRTRADAFVEVANDASFDALWWARGGYGANRIAERVLSGLDDVAREKLYLGYSDGGFLLAGLYKKGFAVAHGPIAADLRREGGEAAVVRGLKFLVERDETTLEPTVLEGELAAAFNLTILSHLIGTPLEPDLTGHVLLLEDVSEPMYAVDRALFHVTSSPNIRKAAGLKLGRISEVPPNDPDFALTDEEVMRYWCEQSGLDYLGRADIGHDVDNKIVPFGRWTTRIET